MITLSTITSVVVLVGAAAGTLGAFRALFRRYRPAPSADDEATEEIDEVDFMRQMREQVYTFESRMADAGVEPATSLFMLDDEIHEVTWTGRQLQLDGKQLHGLLRPDHPPATLVLLTRALLAAGVMVARMIPAGVEGN